MEDLKDIVNEKLRQNSNYREEMLVLISSGEAIAFIGAGLSVPLGYPSWPKLLEKLHAQANELSAFNPTVEIKDNVLRYAQAIKDHHKEHHGIDRYLNLLGREFALRVPGPNCTDTHKRLAALPFRAFVTTNYEGCVESALQYVADEPCPDPGITIKADKADRHRVSLFLRSISDSGKGQRYVAHLHGRHDQTLSFILTAADYAEAYGIAALDGNGAPQVAAITLHRQLAWSLFSTRRMVFVGCSMDDPYVKALLDTVARDLWEAGEKIHFVILPLDSKSVTSAESVAAEFARYGLQVVYFDNLDGKYTALDQLLEEATAKCSAPRAGAMAASPPLHVPTATSAAADKVPPDAPAAGILAIPEWLEEVNVRNAPKMDPA